MRTDVEPTSLAFEINNEHRACEEAVSSALSHAIKAGELLVEAKNGAGHGRWGAWLQENFAGSERAAQAYMRVYRRRDEIRNGAADLSLRGALQQLATPASRTSSKSREERAGEEREKAIRALVSSRDEDERRYWNGEIDRLERVARPVDIPNARERGTLERALTVHEMFLPLLQASVAFAEKEVRRARRIAEREARPYREKSRKPPAELFDDVEEAERNLAERRRRAAKLGEE